VTSPCTTFLNTLITSFRSLHLATGHAHASGVQVTIDPTPFLSAIATVAVALVAIIGGLLVARFVSLDSEQRASRKVLADARERLRLAEGRVQTAWGKILRWDADGFFSAPEVIEAVVDKGIMSPAELMRMANWSHGPDELAPFVTEVAGEVDRAREAISSRIRSSDVFWSDFRRRHRDLPKTRWPRVWEHVYDSMVQEVARAEARRKEIAKRSMTSFERMTAQLTAGPRPSLGYLPGPITDRRATEDRRHDELLAGYARANQQVEDYEAELGRLRLQHAEIVRPDVRLWWGVGILIIVTILGVVVPLLVMATGPRDLAAVRWVLYPFVGSLAVLIGYIVVYLVQLTRNKPDQPTVPA
jgi:hypothetical protein